MALTESQKHILYGLKRLGPCLIGPETRWTNFGLTINGNLPILRAFQQGIHTLIAKGFIEKEKSQDGRWRYCLSDKGIVAAKKINGPVTRPWENSTIDDLADEIEAA